MMKLIKKSAFIGLGLAVFSTAAIKRLADVMAKESKLTEEEGQKLYEDLLKQSAKSKEEFKKKVEGTVKDSITEMDLATSKDMDAIGKRLDKIEKNLEKDTSAEPTKKAK